MTNISQYTILLLPTRVDVSTQAEKAATGGRENRQDFLERCFGFTLNALSIVIVLCRFNLLEPIFKYSYPELTGGESTLILSLILNRSI